jgi:two-component system, NarL family, nitrate/nitrite response regulator NarL
MFTHVCVISANEISREGLEHLLCNEGFDVIFSGASVSEIDEGLSLTQFIAVVDEPDPTQQCQAVDALHASAPNAMAVILAEALDFDVMISCFHAGARGYIVRATRSGPLMTALHLVAFGEKVMPSDLVDALDQRFASPHLDLIESHLPLAPIKEYSENEIEIASASLSPRERDVLCCLMAGYPNKIIARQLDVCEATVKVHVKAILRKLKVQNRTQAAIWASSIGLNDNHLRIAARLC